MIPLLFVLALSRPMLPARDGRSILGDVFGALWVSSVPGARLPGWRAR